jgi:hypothetical protein
VHLLAKLGKGDGLTNLVVSLVHITYKHLKALLRVALPKELGLVKIRHNLAYYNKDALNSVMHALNRSNIIIDLDNL